MSLTNLAFATLSTVILAANLSAMPQVSESLEQPSIQATTINLSAESLKQPYWLSIRTSPDSQIQGQITLNGKVIQVLDSHNTTLNLSSRLKVGRQAIAIRGNYAPAEATVTIELKGSDTQIAQQVSGTGLLNQVLTIEVR